MASQYATLADLLIHYDRKDIVKVSGRDESDKGEINQKAVDTALAEASREIDEYVGARYVLPLTAVSDQIVQFACNIARYYMERGERVKSAVKDYERAVQRLEALKNGDTTLGLDDNEKLPDLAGDGALVESDPLVWSRKNSGGFI